MDNGVDNFSPNVENFYCVILVIQKESITFVTVRTTKKEKNMKNTTVKINGGAEYELNSKVACISLGYSLSCRYKVTKCYLMEDSDGMFVREGGCDSLLFEKDLQSYYLDTKENRKALKALMESKSNGK